MLSTAVLLFTACSKDDESVSMDSPASTAGSIGGHDYVDLGLPSGTLWATCNVGASKPEEYGNYYAWGETKVTDDYKTYKYYDGASFTKYCTYGNFTDNKSELEPIDDAATVNWGSSWQMPSIGQLAELVSPQNTTTEWTKLNDVNGIRITSKSNGKSIFLPAAAYYSKGNLSNENGSKGLYWSRSLAGHHTNAFRLQFYAYDELKISTGSYNYRSDGLTIRPVRVKK